MVKIKPGNILIRMSIACLLDREGVYEKMQEIRESWGLSEEELIPESGFSEWISSYHPDISFTKEAATYYNEYADKALQKRERNEEKLDDLVNEKKVAYMNIFDIEAEVLMKKFGINPKYKNLILKAVVCGIVGESDLPTKEAKFEYDFLLDSSDLQHLIEKDLPVFSSKSGKDNLDRDRDWFYKFKKYRKTLSFEETIGVLAKESCLDNERIEEQLKRYRKFIQK